MSNDTSAPTPSGRYSPVPGDPFRWITPPRVSRSHAEYRRLFPNGVPIRGELTPEQQAHLTRAPR
jgi:hypothetical protein